LNLEHIIQVNTSFGNLDFLAKQVVEGFISGIHKSPFHGFSAEFAEHKVYNPGESTKYIDWKLYAKTDKFYTKRYDDETNLRCHFILDNSSSMHYPKLKEQSIERYNKIGFSTLAIACLMQLLKKQRDAVGLSIYNDTYEYYAPEKGNERHHMMLLHQLEGTILNYKEQNKTDTYTVLHEIAENLHKRSLVILFSDMFQNATDSKEIFEGLQHLKHNKHEVILFHVLDYEKEVDFDFSNQPQRYMDVETKQYIDLYAESAQVNYKEMMIGFMNDLKLQCLQYKINYVPIDIKQDLNQLLIQFLVKRQQFA